LHIAGQRFFFLANRDLLVNKAYIYRDLEIRALESCHSTRESSAAFLNDAMEVDAIALH